MSSAPWRGRLDRSPPPSPPAGPNCASPPPAPSTPSPPTNSPGTPTAAQMKYKRGLVAPGCDQVPADPTAATDKPRGAVKTLKSRPDFPERFGCLEDARAHCQTFCHWYNHNHRHSGIAFLTPADLHRDVPKQSSSSAPKPWTRPSRLTQPASKADTHSPSARPPRSGSTRPPRPRPIHRSSQAANFHTPASHFH